MKTFFRSYGIIALTAVILFSLAACNSDPDNDSGSYIPVTFNALSASVDPTEQTTTELTLTFSEAIEGLSSADISLSIAGVDKGTLSGEGPVYTLGIGGTFSGGPLVVSVEKKGYAISGSPKTTTIFHKGFAKADFFQAAAIVGIAWDGSKFVVVTRDAKIGQSVDGVTWTEVTNIPFTSDRIQSIVWSGNKFVAVARQGQIAYSTDGTAWTRVVSSPFGTDHAQSVTWGGSPGKFVTGGSYLNTSTSTNGETWTSTVQIEATSNEQHYINGLTWGGSVGNEKFIAACFLSPGGGLFESTGGDTWTEISGTRGTTASEAYNCIFWGGAPGAERFIAGSDNKIFYSYDDGVTWSEATHPFGSNRIRSIAWGGGKFIAVGHGGMMAQSSDGETWTELDNPHSGIIYSVAYGNNRFVTVGDTGVAYTYKE